MSALGERVVPAAGELVVRLAQGNTDLEAVIALRKAVFGDEQGITEAFEIDPDDRRSLHALAVLRTAGKEIPVATGRLTLNAGANGEAHIAWVATDARWRRQGFGGDVMRFLLRIADEAMAPAVVLSAQTHALDFYSELGFVPFGRRFEVRKIEHQLMSRVRPGR